MLFRSPDLSLLGSFSALGGDPSGGNLPFGADGTIQLISAHDMFIKNSQLAERETEYNIIAGHDLVFATNPDSNDVNLSTGGINFRMNVNNTEVSKTPLVLAFNATDPVNGGGVLFMAPGSTIQTNGGRLGIEGEGGGITLANLDVVNSPNFNLEYLGKTDLLISGGIYGNNTASSSGSAASGAVITISAPNADLEI